MKYDSFINYLLFFADHNRQNDLEYKRYCSLLEHSSVNKFQTGKLSNSKLKIVQSANYFNELLEKFKITYALTYKSQASDNLVKMHHILNSQKSYIKAAFFEPWFIYLLRLFYCYLHQPNARDSLLESHARSVFTEVLAPQINDDNILYQLKQCAKVVTQDFTNQQKTSIANPDYTSVVKSLVMLIESTAEASFMTTNDSELLILDKFHHLLASSLPSQFSLSCIFEAIRERVNKSTSPLRIKQLDENPRLTLPDSNHELFMCHRVFLFDKKSNSVCYDDILYYCMSLIFHMRCYRLAYKEGVMDLFVKKVILAARMCIDFVSESDSKNLIAINNLDKNQSVLLEYRKLANMLSVAHLEERTKQICNNVSDGEQQTTLMARLLAYFKLDMEHYVNHALHTNKRHQRIVFKQEMLKE
jgi:hypothetical protein